MQARERVTGDQRGERNKHSRRALHTCVLNLNTHAQQKVHIASAFVQPNSPPLAQTSDPQPTEPRRNLGRCVVISGVAACCCPGKCKHTKRRAHMTLAIAISASQAHDGTCTEMCRTQHSSRFAHKSHSTAKLCDCMGVLYSSIVYTVQKIGDLSFKLVFSLCRCVALLVHSKIQKYAT